MNMIHGAVRLLSDAFKRLQVLLHVSRKSQSKTGDTAVKTFSQKPEPNKNGVTQNIRQMTNML